MLCPFTTIGTLKDKNYRLNLTVCAHSTEQRSLPELRIQLWMALQKSAANPVHPGSDCFNFIIECIISNCLKSSADVFHCFVWTHEVTSHFPPLLRQFGTWTGRVIGLHTGACQRGYCVADCFYHLWGLNTNFYATGNFGVGTNENVMLSVSNIIELYVQ